MSGEKPQRQRVVVLLIHLLKEAQKRRATGILTYPGPLDAAKDSLPTFRSSLKQTGQLMARWLQCSRFSRKPKDLSSSMTVTRRLPHVLSPLFYSIFFKLIQGGYVLVVGSVCKYFAKFYGVFGKLLIADSWYRIGKVDLTN